MDRLEITLARPALSLETRADGTTLLTSRQQLGPYSRCVGDWLEHWARETPDVPFLCEKAEDGQWRCMSYADVRRDVWAIGEALLVRGLGPDRPVAALSVNSISMALVMLGAMHAGIPFAPVSQAYATVATDFGKLKHVFGLLEPGLLFVSTDAVLVPALKRAGLGSFEIVAEHPRTAEVTRFGELCETTPTARVCQAFAGLEGDTVAKILFTSGSTGTPKGVVNTHRMMCSNQQGFGQLLPFVAETRPIVVDWLPWNHTAGGNGAFNKVLRNGGTFYIDDGKPVPGEFHKTIANLMSVQSTHHMNVPRGWEFLLAEFERDKAFRQHFFSELDYIGFSGAAMPRHHYNRLLELARKVRGNRILFCAGYGATETAPSVTMVHFANSEPANIGLPVPGTEIKLVPNGDKLELRVRGPNVMPGYWRQPELTRDAFDEEGFYRIGDAVRFLDPTRPEAGMLFDGRVVEDFKLSSATWVNVAAIRASALAAGKPLFRDVVVTGHDREAIGLLVVLNEEAARERFQIGPSIPFTELVVMREVRDFVKRALQELVGSSTGSSNRPCGALILSRPPTLENGELTDKGSVNQRVALANRKAEVDNLYNRAPVGIFV
jgi:feruloyl-CoA synthase